MQSLSGSPSPLLPLQFLCAASVRGGRGPRQLAGIPRCCFRVAPGRNASSRATGAKPALMLSAGEFLARANTHTPARSSPCPNLGVLTTTQRAKNAKCVSSCFLLLRICAECVQERKRAAAHTHARTNTRSCEPEIHWAAG